MTHFLCRLRPPRASFPHDMNSAEAELMGAHAAYWTGLLDTGAAVAFGPVADPAGFWGLALVEAESEERARTFTADDPVILANTGFRYDILPMPNTIARPTPRGRGMNPQEEGRPSRA